MAVAKKRRLNGRSWRKLKRAYYYLNFDDIRLVSFTSADYGLLDEVIAASGVRASLLSRELGTYLTGRHLFRELFPFSYREFCGFFGVKASAESLADYLEKGGFPEFLKTGNTAILAQLQLDILYRDIAVRYGIRDAASLRRLFVYLVSNPAQLFSPSKLTHIAGVKSPTTVLEYISYFEASYSYLISLLPRFAWSVKAQNLAPKKVYIADAGIIKTGSVSFSGNRGALLENCVFNSLRANLSNPGTLNSTEIYYFSGKSGGECDFIVSPADKPSCIQVCWDLTRENQEREINRLVEAMDFFDQKQGTIITFDTQDIIKTARKTINVIPTWKDKIFCD